MNTEDTGSLDTLVQEKLDNDNEFQESLADLSDEDKEQAITSRRNELYKEEAENHYKASAKNAELAKNYKTRAEKAEGKKGDEDPEDPKKSKSDDELSTMDLYTLVEAKVHKEDVAEVVKASKLLGVGLEDALQDDVVKSLLNKRAEERKTAKASNTGTTKASNKKLTDNELLSDLSEGKVPEKGSSEAEDLFWAKRGGKPKN